MTKPTAGPWRGVPHTGYIYSDDALVAVVGGFLTDKDLIPYNGERWAADTQFITAAVNACFTIAEQTGSTPDRVAQLLPDAFALLERISKSKLRDMNTLHPEACSPAAAHFLARLKDKDNAS